MSGESNITRMPFPRQPAASPSGFMRARCPTWHTADIFLAKRETIETLFDLPPTSTQALTDKTALLCDFLHTPLVVLLRDTGAAVFAPDAAPERVAPEKAAAFSSRTTNRSRDLAAFASALERSFRRHGDIAEGVRHALQQG